MDDFDELLRFTTDLATDYLHFIETKFALHRPVVGLLSEALRATKADRVVDLCSGGGGPIPALQKALAAGSFDTGAAASICS